MSVLSHLKLAVVTQEGDKWVLWTKDKKRRLGTHDTAQAAYKQEYAILKSQEQKAASVLTALGLDKLTAHDTLAGFTVRTECSDR